MSVNSTLFEPTSLGALELSNRMVMAPLTRSRALPDATPGADAKLYYTQRASAGLIVTEGICISPEGVGNPRVPGLWNERQVRGWSAITDAVHAAGGTIVAQLWHTGRASHPNLQPDGGQPVGPSAIAIDGMAFARDGLTPHVAPRELRVPEIRAIITQYAVAAAAAREAGFDGVELHGANGYLIDQFLQDNSNRRTDQYGGAVDNRARLLDEVLTAISAAIGADRVGVRLSPSSTFQDMADSDPQTLFSHALDRISRLGLAYLHIVEPGVSGASTEARSADAIDSAWVRERYAGKLIAAGNYTYATAEKVVQTGQVDAVAFGRPFLANPDLPARFATGAPLNEPDRDTFYTEGAKGYTDYPSLETAAV